MYSVEQLVPAPTSVLDDLQDLTGQDYEQATEEYLRRLTRNGGVRFVGQFGAVRTPGVSDLDLVVISEDDCYRSVSETASQELRSIPHGAYIFWHKPVVVPLTLMPVVSVFHTLKNVRPLYGDDSVLALITKPAFPLSTITTVVWNSYFWHVALKLGNKRSLRFLLLVLGNIVQSIAGDYETLGDLDRQQESLEWGHKARQQVLTCYGAERRAAIVGLLCEALRKWLKADWALEEWWVRNLPTLNIHRTAEVDIDRRCLIRFRPRVSSEDRLSRLRSLTRQWRLQLGRRSVWTLPSFYLEVLLQIRPVFAPRLRLPFSEAIEQLEPHGPNLGRWSDAVDFYHEAGRLVREFSCRTAGHDMAMFGSTFVTPFGL